MFQFVLRAEFESYVREKAITAVHSRTGKKLSLQVEQWSLTPATTYHKDYSLCLLRRW